MECLQRFLVHMNDQHPQIRHTDDDCPTLNNLDLAISISDGCFEQKLFIKPIHSGVLLSYKSAHPLACKDLLH